MGWNPPAPSDWLPPSLFLHPHGIKLPGLLTSSSWQGTPAPDTCIPFSQQPGDDLFRGSERDPSNPKTKTQPPAGGCTATWGTRRAPTWLTLHPTDILFYFILFYFILFYFILFYFIFSFYSPRGHRAYLSSAPHYDFPRYRQLVHELTLGFSRISREVLQLQARLRDQHGRPELAQHLARLQEREQEKLQLVSARGWDPPSTPGGFSPPQGGFLSPSPCPPRRRRSSSWRGSGCRTSLAWTPTSRRCGSSSTSRWARRGPPYPTTIPPTPILGTGTPLSQAGILKGAPPSWTFPRFLPSSGAKGGPRWCLQKLLLFGAPRIVWRCRAAAVPSASPGLSVS
uniref:Uncharacterized protein n=1 Tax=Anas zonorhyncha TaxID=75864 RepID=A0A8B9U607_9AVES